MLTDQVTTYGLRLEYLNGRMKMPGFFERVRASFTAVHGICGVPRIPQGFRHRRILVSRHKIACLVRDDDLRALHGYRIRHILGHKAIRDPQFAATLIYNARPNQARATVLTYIWTSGGWPYLAVVVDSF